MVTTTRVGPAARPTRAPVRTDLPDRRRLPRRARRVPPSPVRSVAGDVHRPEGGGVGTTRLKGSRAVTVIRQESHADGLFATAAASAADRRRSGNASYLFLVLGAVGV